MKSILHSPFLPWPRFHFENRSDSPGVGPHLIVAVAVLGVIMGSAASRKRFDYTNIGYTPEVRVCVYRITVTLTMCASWISVSPV
jgi:hypothetical protein